VKNLVWILALSVFLFPTQQVKSEAESGYQDCTLHQVQNISDPTHSPIIVRVCPDGSGTENTEYISEQGEQAVPSTKALQTLNITRDSTKALLICKGVEHNGPDCHWHFHITNIGKTPAYDLTSEICQLTDVTGHTIDVSGPFTNKNLQYSYVLNDADQHYDMCVRASETIDKIGGGVMRMTYRDIYGTTTIEDIAVFFEVTKSKSSLIPNLQRIVPKINYSTVDSPEDAMRKANQEGEHRKA